MRPFLRGMQWKKLSNQRVLPQRFTIMNNDTLVIPTSKQNLIGNTALGTSRGDP